MNDWKQLLIDEIKEISQKKDLKDYDAFVFWYLKTTEDLADDIILESITNKTHDFGVDSVIIDQNMKSIKIIQSKYTASIGDSSFNKDELNKLSKVYRYLSGLEDYSELEKYLNRTLKDRLDRAIRLIKEENYSIKLIFITTHKENPNYSVYDNKELPIQIICSKEIQRKYEEWRHGHTPELGDVELTYLKMMSGPPNAPKAYILTINTNELKKRYAQFKEKLFSRNVRIFYGDAPKPNKNMKETLKNEPQNFWYFNNGITLLSEQIKIDEEKNIISLRNPQIINGCQTVSTIGELPNKQDESYVFAKIIEISDSLVNQNLIDGIIEANNRQTPVDERMLKSNHPLQVKLHRELEQVGFYFERKEGQYSQEKAKSNRIAKLYRISNLELMKANIALIKQPHLAFVKEDDLFSIHFGDVFKEEKSYLDYVLPYLVWWEINDVAKNYRHKNRQNFQKNVSYHLLKILYENCEYLRDNTKKSVLFKKLQHEEPYDSFELDTAPIKKIFDIAYDKFEKSEFKERSSGQRDFVKNTKTFEKINSSVPQYIKREIEGMFE